MTGPSTSPDIKKTEKDNLKEKPAAPDPALSKASLPPVPKPESPVLKQINDAIGTGNIQGGRSKFCVGPRTDHMVHADQPREPPCGDFDPKPLIGCGN